MCWFSFVRFKVGEMILNSARAYVIIWTWTKTLQQNTHIRKFRSDWRTIQKKTERERKSERSYGICVCVAEWPKSRTSAMCIQNTITTAASIPFEMCLAGSLSSKTLLACITNEHNQPKNSPHSINYTGPNVWFSWSTFGAWICANVCVCVCVELTSDRFSKRTAANVTFYHLSSSAFSHATSIEAEISHSSCIKFLYFNAGYCPRPTNNGQFSLAHMWIARSFAFSLCVALTQAHAFVRIYPSR